MVDFRFMYEHKVREMESMALLMYELQKRGYSCDYYPCNGMGGQPLGEAKVVVVPYFYNNIHIDNIERYCKGTSKIVNMQWEQVYQVKDDGNVMCTHYPKDNTQKALHLCWGEKARDSLLKCGVAKQNTAVVGNVKMDFFRPEFRGYYLDKGEMAFKYSIKCEKKWILFISSFSGEARKTDLNGNVIDENEFDKAKTIFLIWIEELLKERPEIEFIYRPHPFEKGDFRLSELAAKYSNFHIIEEESVNQWILVADKIVTWISTATGEVFFANKSCVIVRPLEILKSEDMCTMVEARKATTYKEMLSELDEEGSFPIKKEIIEKYYGSGEIAAYKNICDALVDVLNGDYIHVDTNIKINYGYIFNLKRFFAKSCFYKSYIDIMAYVSNMYIVRYFPYCLRRLMENSKMRRRDYVETQEIEDLIECFRRLRL